MGIWRRRCADASSAFLRLTLDAGRSSVDGVRVKEFMDEAVGEEQVNVLDVGATRGSDAVDAEILSTMDGGGRRMGVRGEWK